MRRKPVAFFLGDAAFLSDAKFRALARRLPDPDDFNSAVGAYFVALAAARRNGQPEIDLAGETASRFLPDLVAVGLLNEHGFPPVAFAAWGPSRPSFPSDVRNAPSAPNDSERSENSADSARTPPPIPSLHIPSPLPGGGPGAGLSSITDAVAEAFQRATGRPFLAAGAFALEYLESACERHPEADVVAAIGWARQQFQTGPTSQQLAVMVRGRLDPLPDTKAAAKADSERREQDASRRRIQATKARIHDQGSHADEPDPMCDRCRGAA